MKSVPVKTPASPAGRERFFVGKNDFSAAQIESFYSGSGLFFEKCVVVLTNVFEREDILDFVLEKLSLLAESQNLFVFLETKLPKSVLEEFKKAGADIQNFDLPKEKHEKYDNFLLAWAFAKRDKLGLWMHYRKAVDLGVGLEELVGVLFWKAKDMLLKNNYGKFSEPELKTFAAHLSYLLPKARKEGLDAECELERFLLEAV